jgi:hypothetical protein
VVDVDDGLDGKLDGPSLGGVLLAPVVPGDLEDQGGAGLGDGDAVAPDKTVRPSIKTSVLVPIRLFMPLMETSPYPARGCITSTPGT